MDLRSEQHLVVGGPRERDFRRRQMRIVFQVQLRRPPFDRAQYQMLEGIEGYGRETQCPWRSPSVKIDL